MNKYIWLVILSLGHISLLQGSLVISNEIVLLGSKGSEQTPAIYDCKNRTDCLYLTGKITQGDFAKLKPHIEQKVKSFFLDNYKKASEIINYAFTNYDNPDPPSLPEESLSQFQILINSDGGDAEEALKIAKFIRKLELAVTIPMDKKCLSSCFFIYAGAVLRSLGNSEQLGVHTPYFERDFIKGLTQEETELLYLGRVTQVYEQLRGFNIPDDLIEKMKNTPSSDIYYLDNSEVNEIQFDPIYRERLLAQVNGEALFEDAIVELQNKAFHNYFGDLDIQHTLGNILKDNENLKILLSAQFASLPFFRSEFDNEDAYFQKIAQDHPATYRVLMGTQKNWYESILNIGMLLLAKDDLQLQKSFLGDYASDNIEDNNYSLLVLVLLL